MAQEQGANDHAEAGYQEIDGLMVLLQERERIDFLTGTQLFFLLEPIREHLDEIRRLTRGPGPSPSVGAAAVLNFPRR